MLVQIFVGVVLLLSKNKAHFALYDTTIQNALRGAMDEYCQYLPVSIPDNISPQVEREVLKDYYNEIEVEEKIGEYTFRVLGVSKLKFFFDVPNFYFAFAIRYSSSLFRKLSVMDAQFLLLALRMKIVITNFSHPARTPS